MDRAVFDSSVWVSSIGYPRSVPDQAIDAARFELVESITSEDIIDQVSRALMSRRFGHLPIGSVAFAMHEMQAISRIVSPEFSLAVVTAKESDNRILECAVAGGAAVIVTGDRKHLLPLRSYQGIRIVSPVDFLRAYRLPRRLSSLP